jgi:hypothetical protein
MLSRILFSTAAAAVLAAAAPAYAGDAAQGAEARPVPKCCDHLAMHMYGVAPEPEAGTTPDRLKDKTIQNPLDEDPDVRNQSWGG